MMTMDRSGGRDHSAMSRRVLLFAVLFSLVAAAIVWDRANLSLVRTKAPPRTSLAAEQTPADPDEIVLVIGGSHDPAPEANGSPAEPPRPRTDERREAVVPRPRPGPPEPPKGKELRSHAPERRVRVAAGETLRSIASRELGDPALWSVLAEANGIADPTRLRAGDEIVVPRVGGR